VATDTASQPPPARQAIAVELRENRFFAALRAADGQSLSLLIDSGGGQLNLDRDAAVRLHLPLTPHAIGGEPYEVTPMISLAPGSVFPPIRSLDRELDGWLVVAPPGLRLGGESDGLLGSAWLRDRVWTFDYPGHALWLHPAGAPGGGVAHRASLGFQVNAGGERTTHFARIAMRVDGVAIEMLFDTGATVQLSAAALNALHDGRPRYRATSFIIASIFERWRTRHPDWRVIDSADEPLREAMIEVPSIELAGFSVGPVWFTRRADPNFTEWMSEMMDQPIQGALGGSALGYFRITVDYPNAVAVFERPAER
jgi:hypothetical protein